MQINDHISGRIGLCRKKKIARVTFDFPAFPVSHANGQLSKSVLSVTFESVELYFNYPIGNIRKRKTNRIIPDLPVGASILKRGLHYKRELYIGLKGYPELREYHPNQLSVCD